MFNDAVYVGCECPFCGKYHDVRVSEADYWNWKGGELAQDAFPYLTAEEREFLISGICPDCWNKIFGGKENQPPNFRPGRRPSSRAFATKNFLKKVLTFSKGYAIL